MYAEREEEKPKFIPVKLVLETQEEVDKLYGMFLCLSNHTVFGQTEQALLQKFSDLSAYGPHYSKMRDYL